MAQTSIYGLVKKTWLQPLIKFGNVMKMVKLLVAPVVNVWTLMASATMLTNAKFTSGNVKPPDSQTVITFGTLSTRVTTSALRADVLGSVLTFMGGVRAIMDRIFICMTVKTGDSAIQVGLDLIVQVITGGSSFP